MDADKPNMLRPALAGGLIGAVLSIAPPFCCLNLCCGLDYIVAGVVAGVMYARRAGAIRWFPQAGEGVGVGALAGLVAALIDGVVRGLVLLAFALASAAGTGRAWAHGPGELAWRRDWGGGDPGDVVALLVIAAATFFGGVFIGLVAGAVGGLLGVVLFRSTPPPAAEAPPPAAGPPPAPGSDL